MNRTLRALGGILIHWLAWSFDTGLLFPGGWCLQVTSQKVGIRMWTLNRHNLLAHVQLGCRSTFVLPKGVERRLA